MALVRGSEAAGAPTEPSPDTSKARVQQFPEIYNGPLAVDLQQIASVQCFSTAPRGDATINLKDRRGRNLLLAQSARERGILLRPADKWLGRFNGTCVSPTCHYHHRHDRSVGIEPGPSGQWALHCG